MIPDLRNRLINDPSLRRICDFDDVPSTATVSRRLKDFSEGLTMAKVLITLVTRYHEGRITGYASRDSTAIEARETPAIKKSYVVSSRPKR